MKATRDGRLMKVEVSADGAGLVSHAGSGLLAAIADRVGLTKALSRELAGLRERRGGHDPGRVIRDLAVMLADGGDCLADLRAVRDQADLFGAVASDSTAYRVIDSAAGTRRTSRWNANMSGPVTLRWTSRSSGAPMRTTFAKRWQAAMS